MSSIIFIRFSSLGDVLLTEPILRAAREKYPGRKLILATRAQYGEYVRQLPWDIEPLLWNEQDTIGDFCTRMQKLDPGRIYDLHGSLRSRRLCGHCGVAVNRVQKHYLQRWLLVNHFSHRALPNVINRYAAVLPFPVFDTTPRWYHYPESPDTNAKTRSLVLIPGAGKPTKEWLPRYWEELVRRLVRSGYRIHLAGGEKEYQLGVKLQKVHPERVQNHCGQLTLAENAVLMRDALLVVGGDTGLTHLAVSTGTRVLFLAGGTVAELGFFPEGEGVQRLEVDLPCRPCSHVGLDQCPLHHFECMTALTVETVYTHVMEMIGSLA